MKTWKWRKERFSNFIKADNDGTIFIVEKLYESTFSTLDIIFLQFHKVKYELIRIYISEIGIPSSVNLKYLFPAKYIHVIITLLYILIIVNILNIILLHDFNITCFNYVYNCL